MEKIVSKFQIEMAYGRPVIKMLDISSPITESVIVLESDSLSKNMYTKNIRVFVKVLLLLKAEICGVISI